MKNDNVAVTSSTCATSNDNKFTIDYKNILSMSFLYHR